MPEIDNLEIRIKTSASSAANDLNLLAKELENAKSAAKDPRALGSYASRLESLADAVSKIDSGSLAKLSVLTSSLESLSKLSGVKISSTINKNLVEIANSVSKISDKDIARIEKLANAIGKLGVLQSGGTGNKVNVSFKGLEEASKSSKSLNANLKNSITLTEGFSRATNTLHAAWVGVAGVITGAFSLLKRAMPGIQELVDSSSQYIKNLNRFNVVMGEFADSEYEYAMRVQDVMGIDSAQWLDYEATFMTLGTGFGVATDRAVVMSRQLTQLGYDLASFNNIEIGDAMQRVQSAFAGELEPVRRLGYDLSQTRLQAYATEMGITTLVSSMTQAEKSQLRYYALMTQMTEAQHDMALTLNAPSNQLRIFSNYLTLAGRSIGNIFIPLLNKIIPYAIAAARAVRTLADAIASLLGFELPEFDNSLRSVSVAADDAGALADNLGAGARATQKMKDNLQKFDELNVLRSPNDNNGGGSGLGALGSSLDFDLPTYDFLAGAVEQNVDSIYNRLMSVLRLDDVDPQEVGRSIARRINDVFQSIDTYTPGRTLGERFTAIFDLAYGYFDERNGYLSGAIAANFFNGIIDGFSGESLARAFNAALQFAFDSIRGFIDTLNWYGIGQDIGDAIRGIDWYGIFVSLVDIGDRVIRAIFDVIRGAITGGGGRSGSRLRDLTVNPSDNSSVAWRIAYETTQSNRMVNRQSMGLSGLGSEMVTTIADSVTSQSAIDVLTKALGDLFSLAFLGALTLLAETGQTFGENIAEIFSDTFEGGHWEADSHGNVYWVDSSESEHAGTSNAFTDWYARMRDDHRNPWSAAFGDSITDNLHSGVDRISDQGTGLNDFLHGAVDFGSVIWNAPGVAQDTLDDTLSSFGIDPDDYWSTGDWGFDLLERGVGHLFGNGNGNGTSRSGGSSSSHTAADFSNRGNTGSQANEEEAEEIEHEYSTIGGIIVGMAEEAEEAWNDFWGISSKDGSRVAGQLSKNFTSTSKVATSATASIEKGFERERIASNNAYNVIKDNNNRMISVLNDTGNRFQTETVSRFTEGSNRISAIVSQLSTDTSQSMDSMGARMYESITATTTAMVTPLNSLKDHFVNTYKTAGEEATAEINRMGSSLSASFNGVIEHSKGALEGYKGTWDGLKGTVKDTSNWAIAGAEGMANGITDAYNQIIRNLKNMDVTIPNVGNNPDAGKKLNGEFKNLNALERIRIPRLGKGGSVRNSTYANIGEAGREAVIPLDKDTSWADVFIAKTQQANAPALAEQNALLRQEIEILRAIAAKNVTIASSDVYSAVRSENEDMVRRTGVNPLAI